MKWAWFWAIWGREAGGGLGAVRLDRWTGVVLVVVFVGIGVGHKRARAGETGLAKGQVPRGKKKRGVGGLVCFPPCLVWGCEVCSFRRGSAGRGMSFGYPLVRRA
ncbi:uncharacterized protein K452DRAFT_282819, partial [Aplosporella prunicola CBS 121167]